MVKPRIPLALSLLMLGAGCNVGELNLQLVHSWAAEDDPFEDLSWIKIQADSGDHRAGPVELPFNARKGTLDEVPVGDSVRIDVEGLGINRNRLSLGRSGPLEISSGQNTISLFIGKENATSFAPHRLKYPRAFHTATRLRDGSVLVCGGIDKAWRPESDVMPQDAVATSEIFDGVSLERNAFSPSCTDGKHAVGCMYSARLGHTASLMGDGKVVVAGGHSGTSLVPEIEIYVPSSKLGRFVNSHISLKTPRWWHAAGVFGRDVLLVGGADAAGQLVSQSEAFVEGESKTTSKSAVKARTAMTLTTLKDGRLLISGGVGQGGPLDTLEIWDPETGLWTIDLPRLNVARAYHTATLTREGKVLFIGGLSSIDGIGTATNTIERYDPVTNKITWDKESSLKKLDEQLWSHTATLLDNDNVLVTGGFTQNKNSGAADTIYEVVLSRDDSVVEVNTIGIMKQLRAGHTATRLRSGMVLIVGGSDGSTVSNTVEVYVYPK